MQRPTLNSFKRLKQFVSGSAIFNPFRRLNSFVYRKPLFTSIVVCTTEGLLADYFTQKIIENRTWNKVNKRRLIIFGCFGLVAHGLLDYWLINKFYWYLFPGKDFLSVTKKVLFDQAVIVPFAYFPAFYNIRQLIFYGTNGYDIKKVMNQYKQTCIEDCVGTWMIWTPAQYITFMVLPKPWRLVYMSGVGLVWLTGVSYFRGGSHWGPIPEDT